MSEVAKGGDWKANIMSNLGKYRRDSSERRTRSVLLRFWPEGHELMAKAARRMGVNQNSYMRRAIAVQIAKHLNLPLSTVLRGMLPQGREDYGVFEIGGLPYDSGQGIADYCPHPGCDGAHWAYIEKERPMTVQPTEVETTLDTTTDPIVTGPPEPTEQSEQTDEQ